MELFDFVKTLFGNPTEFKKISMHERGKHFFMCNRFMAIKFPIQASYMNNIKIHPGQAVTYWQETVGKMYTKTPGWMYTKVSKKKADKSGINVSEAAMNYYCQKKQISRKVLDEAINFVGDPIIKELKDIENLMVKNS